MKTTNDGFLLQSHVQNNSGSKLGIIIYGGCCVTYEKEKIKMR